MSNFFTLATQGLVAYQTHQDNRNDQRANERAEIRRDEAQQRSLTARTRNVSLGIGALTVLGAVFILKRRKAA